MSIEGQATEEASEDIPEATVPPPLDFEAVPDNWAEVEASKKNTGQFTNRLFVQHLGDGLIRLNFGEILDQYDTQYHTALVLSSSSAMQFAELIYRMGQAAKEAMSPPMSADDGKQS